MTQNQKNLIVKFSKRTCQNDQMGKKGTCISEGKIFRNKTMCFLMQYNAYFYCMMMLGICLITFLAIVTKKRKIQTIANNITPSMPLNDSASPNKESNDKDTFSSFQENQEQHEQGNPINLHFSRSS